MAEHEPGELFRCYFGFPFDITLVVRKKIAYGCTRLLMGLVIGCKSTGIILLVRREYGNMPYVIDSLLPY